MGVNLDITWVCDFVFLQCLWFLYLGNAGLIKLSIFWKSMCRPGIIFFLNTFDIIHQWDHLLKIVYFVQKSFIINYTLGLRWWRSSKESACQCSGQWLDPWSGKISHAQEKLSPCATITEDCMTRAQAPQQEKPPQWEARALPQRVALARHN